MGYFLDNENNITIYEAPKTGGTTLRIWIAAKFTKKISINGNPNGYFIGTTKNLSLIMKNGYRNDYFKAFKTKKKICILRPIVERFVSCYMDKIYYENSWKLLNLKNGLDIDNFLSIIESKNILNIYKKYPTDDFLKNKTPKKILEYHFAPFTNIYGSNINYYKEIFTTNKMCSKGGLREYLEYIWKINLPNIHSRNAKDRIKIKLNNEQISRIRKIYSIDIQNGYDI